MQEIQIQRPDQQIQQATPLIIANINPTAMLNGQQLIQTANGQIIQAQIGQFVPSNNTIQMITTNPAPQPQLLQIRPESDNRLTELIVQQPNELSEPHHQYYDEIPVVLQSANGQQTILNLPHHQVQALQQQAQQQHQQQQQQHHHHQLQQAITTSSSETDEIEIHEVQNYDDDDYACEDMEEVVEEEIEQEIIDSPSNSTTTYYIQDVSEEIFKVDQEETIDKQIFSEFLSQHTNQEGPSKFSCNLCHNEFKNMKSLESHMKLIHSNWIKANCKKQPKCQICGKSFRGPGMLKMHQKVRFNLLLLSFNNFNILNRRMNEKIKCQLVVSVVKNLSRNQFYIVIERLILLVKSNTFVRYATSHSIQIIN